MTQSPYQALEARFARLGTLQEAAAVLHWDAATLMPSGGAAARAEQLATLKVVCHEVLTDAALPDLFGGAGAQSDLDPWQHANLAEMRRRWAHATAVPADLVEALSKACSASEMRWRDARPAGDFAAMLPALHRVLELVRQVAAAKAAALGKTPYEALLDEYEPGGSTAAIDRLFSEVAGFLPGLIDAALQRQHARPAPLPLPGPFPIAAQRQLGLKLMERLGFDFAHGRLDVSLHPFCGGTPDDVRLTTRYEEADFNRALMGVLHETGHALYERGLPAQWRRQPVGDARGMSIHESQSLLVEMQACRSREFAEFAAPLLREAFGGSGPAWESQNLYRLNTRVERSLIRVDADEVTYPAHVILRYRLERAMIAGDLALEDLPSAWRDAMRELVGIVPPDDRQGCLQDIHWYDGAWGYFPTYTLGAMTAAQLFDAAKRADPAILPGIARGDFAPLLAWLRANVHGKGSRFSTAEIIEQATGRPLESAVFRRHLEARYANG
ncbi:MAG TPA: carboxypeptidase M32 [Stellaceae bacterium]|nr:carboxypeptidase M32 [Stellaceae bacterium]